MTLPYTQHAGTALWFYRLSIVHQQQETKRKTLSALIKASNLLPFHGKKKKKKVLRDWVGSSAWCRSLLLLWQPIKEFNFLYWTLKDFASVFIPAKPRDKETWRNHPNTMALNYWKLIALTGYMLFIIFSAVQKTYVVKTKVQHFWSNIFPHLAECRKFNLHFRLTCWIQYLIQTVWQLQKVYMYFHLCRLDIKRSNL